MQPQIVIPDISGYHNKDIQKSPAKGEVRKGRQERLMQAKSCR